MDSTLAQSLKDRALDVLALPARAIALVLLILLLVYAWDLHKRGF